jgi:Tfp pilus assembly protein PilE
VNTHTKEIMIGILVVIGVAVVSVAAVAYHAYDADVIRADAEARIKLHEGFKK